MSFDIFLQRFQNGECAEIPRADVLEILQNYSHEPRDQFGFYVVHFPDGTCVEFSAKGLESEVEFQGCAFFVRRFGHDLMKFIFDVARAGHMIILPSSGAALAVCLSEDQTKDLPQDIVDSFDVVTISSSDELQSLLVDGFKTWETYKNHVTDQM